MTTREFLRVLPLMVVGSYLFAYAVKYEADHRAFWAVLGAISVFLAGILIGLYLANSPSGEEELPE